MTILNKKNVFLSLITLLLIAVFFWTQSRFPALDQKVQMGDRTPFSAIAFEHVFAVSAEQNLLERVLANFGNWVITNWQGMSFGLLFGATFLAFLSSVRFSARSFRNPLLNSVYGSLLGAPLGVCANCATPISIGFYKGGLPRGTALAGLSASPTLNVLVLTMSFSLLPLELVALKYLFVAVYLILILPLLVLVFIGDDHAGGQHCTRSDHHDVDSRFGMLWLRSLFYLLKLSFPLMILAGFLGVVLAESLPSEQLSEIEFNVLVLILIAFFATFFPVPIAFDVIVCAVLLNLGVEVAYVAAAFFALGIFSIYPAMVIARDMSLKLSVAIFISVTVLASLVGWLSHVQMAKAEQQQQAQLSHLLDAHHARHLMRFAARQCHQLDSRQQQTCFKGFVRDTLVTQFDQRACVHLEDAMDYRESCEHVFLLSDAIALAIASDSTNACDALAEGMRSECLYALISERAVANQSVLPCLTLDDSGQREYCQGEVLALNAEIYDLSSVCTALPQSQLAACLSDLKQVQTMNRVMAQNHLPACLKLETPREQQYCQGVVMVNLLEQGASLDVCSDVQDLFLKQRCYSFKDYFEALDMPDISGCMKVHEAELREQCRFEWVQKRLRHEQIKLRKGVMGEALESVQFTMDSEPEQVITEVSKAPALKAAEHFESDKVRVQSYDLNEQSKEGSGFISLDAEHIGIQHRAHYSMLDFFEPFQYGRGIASGDINADLWPDLAIAEQSGVSIYRNTGGRFERQQLLDLNGHKQAMAVAFADLNQDASPDLFVSYYGGVNKIFYNRNGVFSVENSQDYHHPNTNLTMALGFSDPDRDGDIDMVWGGWSYGDTRHFRPVKSTNVFVENLGADDSGKAQFKITPLEGPAGETLSVLFSDLNHDGQEELIIANDRDTPDLMYRWQNGRYQLVYVPAEGLPSLSSFNTMSLDSGDLNNDLKLDYFSTDMTFGSAPYRDYCSQSGISDAGACRSYLEAHSALQKGQVAQCQTLPQDQQADCLNAHLVHLALASEESALCSGLLGENQTTKDMCYELSSTLPVAEPLVTRDLLPGRQKNVLMLSGDNGFEDAAQAYGVESSFWSWNARLADLDNDGWQDILVANGYGFGRSGTKIHSNVFFHNLSGQGFNRAEDQFGLTDYLNTASFTLIDFDMDGDLDVISNRFAAAPGVYQNQSFQKSIQLSVLDEKGVEAIGSKVILHFAQASPQMRELKSSGGLLSFDPVMAHFGLGENQAVALEIIWPDGEVNHIKMNLQPNKHYKVNRKL